MTGMTGTRPGRKNIAARRDGRAARPGRDRGASPSQTARAKGFPRPGRLWSAACGERRRGPGRRSARPRRGIAKLDTGPPRWWRIASLLQWLLAATAVVGARVDRARRRRRLPPDRGRRAALPDVAGAPIPTWLVLGGLALGLVLSFLTRLVNSAGARRRQRAADRALRPRHRVGRRRTRPRPRRTRARGTRGPAPVTGDRRGRALVALSPAPRSAPGRPRASARRPPVPHFPPQSDTAQGRAGVRLYRGGYWIS